MTGIVALAGTVFGRVRVTASPEIVLGTTPGLSGQVTATVEEGVGPFSYSWIRSSGEAGIGPTSPNTAATRFSGVDGTAYFYCRVTDAAGRTGDSNTVEVTMSPGGPVE